MTDLPLPSALRPADRMAIELIVKEVAARRSIYGDAGRPMGDLAKRLQGRIWAATSSLQATLRIVDEGSPELVRHSLAYAVGDLVDAMVELATEPVEQRVEA